MAKIDDLAELLVEEISDFKVQLQRMEEYLKIIRFIVLKVNPNIYS